MLWTALIIGLSGSLHCVGMCGPIALMIPGSKGTKRWMAIALYHTGKILAYMTLGSFFGMVPALLSSFKIQSAITIFAGAFILILAALPFILTKVESKGFSFFNRLIKFKNKMAAALNKNREEYSFYIGFLNGFIPCGMVYLAAIGAMSQPDFISSIFFMFLFGVGTIPVMTLFLFGAGIFKSFSQNGMLQFKKLALVAVGLFMIWKGFVHYQDNLAPPLEGEVFNACAVVHPDQISD